MAGVQIVIVDDHSIVREGLRFYIDDRTEHTVAGEAETEDAAVNLVATHRPELVLMDLNLTFSEGGVQATRRIKDVVPDVRVLGLSGHNSPALVLDMLEAGADGYILKENAGMLLNDAIDAVLGGDEYIDSNINLERMEQLRAKRPGQGGRELSPREEEILASYAALSTAPRVAAELDVGVKTVETHLRAIRRKKGLTTAGEMTKYAVGRGLIHP